MRITAGAPTRRGAWVLAAGCAAVGGGVGLGETGLLRIGVLLLALPLLAALGAAHAATGSRLRLDCRRRLAPARLPVGQESRMSVRLTNRGSQRTPVLVAEDMVAAGLPAGSPVAVDPMEPGHGRDICYRLRAQTRGRFPVGPLRVRVTDAFGLVQVVRSLGEPARLTVTPRVVPLVRSGTATSHRGDRGYLPGREAAAAEDDAAPRAYRDGDALRRVHWRSTARRGRLMVRQEEPWSRTTIHLFVDTRQGAHVGGGTGSSFERSVSVAASIAVGLGSADTRIQLATDVGPLAAAGSLATGGSSTAALLDALAVLEPSHGTRLDMAAARDRTGSGSFVAVVGRLTAAEAGMLAAVGRGTPATAVLTVAPEKVPDPAAAVLTAAGWRVATVTSIAALPDAWRELQQVPSGRFRAAAVTTTKHLGSTGAGSANCADPAVGSLGSSGFETAGGSSDVGRPTIPRGTAAPARWRPTASVRYRLTVTSTAAVLLVAASLYGLLAGQRWWWAGAGAVAVAAGIGVLTRLRPLPVILCLATGLAGLLGYLDALFAAKSAWLVVVPSRRSIGYLWRLAGQGILDADRYHVPAPATPGLLLLTTAGIGLVAVATDLVAVRLRSPAVAGVPLLALFGIPLAMPAAHGGVGSVVVFCIGAAGYLAMLAADHRCRGRPSTAARRPPSPATEARTHPAGLRAGLGAVAVAVAVPLLTPGLAAAPLLVGHGGAGTGGPGTGSASGRSAAGGPGLLPGPLVGLDDDLHAGSPKAVLTYRTTGPTPPYLQVYVLGDLTSATWRSTSGAAEIPLAGSLPPTPGATATDGRTVTTTVTLAPEAGAVTGRAALPLPYPTTRLSVSGHWDVDPATLVVTSAQTRLAGLRYTARGQVVNPTARQLADAPPPPASIRRGDLQVPAAFRSLTPLADRVTRGATSPFGEAVALQRWFTETGGFSYRLNTQEPDSAAALDHFLTGTRSGYCQQFAFAMAVLAREVGIPSRVVVGFTSGKPQGNGTWAVTTADAHAWPELYFAGAGWLRFEPTPSGPAGQGTAYPPAYTTAAAARSTTGGGAASTGGGRAPLHVASPRGNAAFGGHLVAPTGGGVAGDATAGSAAHGTSKTLVAVVAATVTGLAVAALAAPRSLRSLHRRRRQRRNTMGRTFGAINAAPGISRTFTAWRARTPANTLAASGTWADPATGDRADPDGAGTGDDHDVRLARAAWCEFVDDLADFRIGVRTGESPRATARRVVERLELAPAAADAVRRIATAEERARYARASVRGDTLPTDVLLARHAVAGSVGRAARWRARLFPASVFASLHPGGGRAAHRAWTGAGRTGASARRTGPDARSAIRTGAGSR